MRAHVLSRTQNLNTVIIYDGILQDFFAKADGTISYVVLHDASTSVMEIGSAGAAHSPARLPLDMGGSVRGTQPFLVITSEDIANVYFEPLNSLRLDEGTDTSILDRAIDEMEQAAGQPTPA